MEFINLFIYYIIRKPLINLWRLFIRINLNKSIVVNSLPQIDVVVCVIEKDLSILPRTIAGVRKNCLNPIKDIFIVAPYNSQIVDFCSDNNVIFVHELRVYNKDKINSKKFIYKGEDRTGWIYQQVLKLSFNYGSCENYLVIDADHQLNKPHLFVNAGGLPVFYVSDEFNLIYYLNSYKLLRIKPYLFSFISHKCVFNKRVVEELSKEIIHLNGGTDWILSLLGNIRSDISGSVFSEYEFYCCYFYSKYNCVLKPWNNLNIRRSSVEHMSLHEFKKFDTFTFPSYLK
jgi:hypothetical protein